MSKTKLVSQSKHTDKIVDNVTGEIVQERTTEDEQTLTIIKQEPPYVKLYIQDLLYLSDMPKGLTNVVYSLVSRATYANPRDTEKGLIIGLTGYIREEICKECGYKKIQSLNNDITKLLKGNIIKRIGTGTYQLNPYLFGKGEWKDINKIRMSWIYDIHGRTFGEVAFGYKTDDNGQISMDLEQLQAVEPIVEEPVEQPKKRGRKKKSA